MLEKIYCPRCGKQFSDKTSFCRTCGLALGGVREIVNGEAAGATVLTSRPNPTALRIGVGLFIFGTVLGLVNVGIRDLELFPKLFGKMVFLAFVCAGLMTLGGAFIFPSRKYSKRKEDESPSDSKMTGGLATAPPLNELPPADPENVETHFPKDDREAVLVEPASVTDHTTRRLE